MNCNSTRRPFFLLAMLAIVFISAPTGEARADDDNELVAGFGPFTLGNSGAGLDAGSGSTIINIAGGYFVKMNDFLQIGGKLGVFHQSSGGGITIIQVIPGVRFYFGASNDLEEQFFVEPLVGITHTNAGTGSTDFTFQLGVGKRFDVFNSVSLSPSVGIYKVGAASVRFFLKPVEFSIFF